MSASVVQVEWIRHVPSDARGDTRVNADDLGATDDPLMRPFPFGVLGDISMDPSTRAEPAMPATLHPRSGQVRSRPRGAQQPRSVLWFH
jgi:hypothetical protein